MYCSKCGGKIDDNARFCDFCGEAVTEQTVQPSTQADTLSNNSSNTDSGNSGGGSNGNANGSSNVWLPVGLAVLGVVIGWYLSGFGGFVLGVWGAGLAAQQKKRGLDNQAPRILTYILAVICAIFWYMAATA